MTLLDDISGEGFRGCILAEKDGCILLERAYGYADMANRVKNTVDTRFATASAGKAFVAVGILQLVEKGLLKLDDAIGGILDIELKQIDPQITVEQLLSHTSGIPDYFDEDVMDEYEELWRDFPNYRIRSNSDLLPLFINKPMQYPRGERFHYNNTGYVVLAMLMERITGMAFDAYLHQSVFGPCGMTSTGYYELDMLPERCAHNYIFDEARGGWRTNIFSVDAKGTGAGGAFTTVGDIRRFWHALSAHILLSREMSETMLSDHSGEGCYGYGMWLKRDANGSFPYFQGEDPGVSFVSSLDAARGLLTVAVSNYGDDVWEIARRIARNLT